MEASESTKKTLAQVVAFYTQDTTVVSQKDVAGEPASKGCSNLKEVISKGPAIPPRDAAVSVPNIINTDFFCELDGHKVVTVLRNWNGDKRQEQYRQVALRIAKAIEPTRQSNAFAVDCASHWDVLLANDSTIDLLSFPPAERLEGRRSEMEVLRSQ